VRVEEPEEPTTPTPEEPTPPGPEEPSSPNPEEPTTPTTPTPEEPTTPDTPVRESLPDTGASLMAFVISAARLTAAGRPALPIARRRRAAEYLPPPLGPQRGPDHRIPSGGRGRVSCPSIERDHAGGARNFM